MNDEEGQALREKTCANPLHNACCYLCDDQETCEISCQYLGKTAELPEQVSEESADLEVGECLRAVESLSTQFNEGRIDRQFYSYALSTIATALDDARAILNSEGKKEYEIEVETRPDVVAENAKMTASLVLPDGNTLQVEKMRIIKREDLGRYVSAKEAWWISKEHCVVFEDNGRFYLQDNGSMNGTKLNGLSITGKGKNEIEDGDEIIIADKVKLKFVVRPSSNS